MKMEYFLIMDVSDAFCINFKGCQKNVHMFTIMVNCYIWMVCKCTIAYNKGLLYNL